MASTRCPNCNFLNFASEPACKKCRQPLGNNASEPAFAGYETAGVQMAGSAVTATQFSQQPPVRQSGSSYYNPPPPNFYDDLRSDHPAPTRNDYSRTVTISIPPVCVKCGSHDQLAMQKFKKDYTPPAAYLGFLAGPIPFLIILLIARKRHNLNGLFCGECWTGFRTFMPASTISALLVLGFLFGGIIMSFVLNTAFVGFLGVIAALGTGIYGSYYTKKISPKFVKTNRKQVYIDIPRYGEVDFTHSAL